MFGVIGRHSLGKIDSAGIFYAANLVGLKLCAGTSVLWFPRMSVAFMRVSSNGDLRTTGQRLDALLAEGAMTVASTS